MSEEVVVEWRRKKSKEVMVGWRGPETWKYHLEIAGAWSESLSRSDALAWGRESKRVSACGDALSSRLKPEHCLGREIISLLQDA